MAELAACEIVMKHNLAVIADSMKDLGLETIEVSFDGRDDRRSITKILFWDGGPSGKDDEAVLEEPVAGLQREVSPTEREAIGPVTLRTALQTATFDILDLDRGGWDEGDGSFGDVTIDHGSAALNMSYRLVEEDFARIGMEKSPIPEPAPEPTPGL